MKTSCYRLIIGIGLFFFLVGCGFHLRQKWYLAPPLRSMFLETKDPYGQLARALKQLLRSSGMSFVESKDKASTILHIEQDNISQALLGVNATQQTRQYKLTLTIRFTLQNNQGGNILPLQSLEDTRVITIQSNQILGSSNEISVFTQLMRSGLASTIMDRLQSPEITDLLMQYSSPPKRQ